MSAPGSLWTTSAALAVLTLSIPLSAQEPNAADVTSQDAIIEALYDVISGPAGEARDWDRFRSLFIPEGARLIPVGRQGDGTTRPALVSVDEYVERAGPNLEATGFFEAEVHAEVEEYGAIAHRFSTYESRRTADDAEPFDAGINSIQLVFDGDRWWIVSIMWTSERSGVSIPDRYRGG
ncbi:MAG: hypothetical protein OEZ65_12630 [Gemmatimonadota bacterium]|nr:hypothetical protein [Gemmatimonadota bacterium]